MNDAFLLLTPLLMLPIVALLGFVGCDKVFTAQGQDFPKNYQDAALEDQVSDASMYLRTVLLLGPPHSELMAEGW